MKYAIVDGIREEASKGLVGYCPLCGEKLIAKCGNYKINHWSHTNNSNCNFGKEHETEWHRMWKNNYPNMYQEVIFTNKERDYEEEEIHIADVYTKGSYVIEFQHSHISDEEKFDRENFYRNIKKNMIWVVDGTRLKTDNERFFKKGFIQRSEVEGVLYTDEPENTLPKSWQNSTVPVFIDFQGLNNDNKIPLYCIIPQKIFDFTIIIPISRKIFVATTLNGGLICKLVYKMSEFAQSFLLKKLKEEQEQYKLIKTLKHDSIDSLYYSLCSFSRTYKK